MARNFRPEGYVGVDINPRYISRARTTKSGYRFEVADAQWCPYADGSFEAVLIGGVIHHLDDASARTVLEETRRVLVPGRGTLGDVRGRSDAEPMEFGLGALSSRSTKEIALGLRSATSSWPTTFSAKGSSAAIRCGVAWARPW